MDAPNGGNDAGFDEKRIQKKERLAELRRNLDRPPMGTGPANRHGMPKLPPGQHVVTNWPVLDLGVQPDVGEAAWQLRVDGEVERPLTLSWADFMALPQVEDVSDFHCVTSWSRFDNHWVGVRLKDLLALARPREGAGFVMCHAYDGYSTNLPLAEALKDDVLLVHSWEGRPLPREHGGPVRMITPQLWAWKGAKWINRIELMTGDKRGFWEERGYSNTALPWENDRYA